HPRAPQRGDCVGSRGPGTPRGSADRPAPLRCPATRGHAPQIPAEPPAPARRVVALAQQPRRAASPRAPGPRGPARGDRWGFRPPADGARPSIPLRAAGGLGEGEPVASHWFRNTTKGDTITAAGLGPRS